MDIKCLTGLEESGFKKPDCVAVLGLNLHNFIAEISLCSENELPSDLDLLEIYRSEDKHELRRIFAGLCLEKCGLRLPESTHEERVRVADEFLEKINGLDYIISSHLFGSVSTNQDNELSDVDIKVFRNYCPGIKDCRIPDLLKSEDYKLIDLSCYPGKQK